MDIPGNPIQPYRLRPLPGNKGNASHLNPSVNKQLLHIPRHIGYLRGRGLTVPQPLMHISGLRLRRKQSPRILHHLPAGIAALNIFIELILHRADFLLNHGKGILRLLPLLRRPNRGKKNRNAQKTQHAQYQNRRRIPQKLPPVYLYLQKRNTMLPHPGSLFFLLSPYATFRLQFFSLPPLPLYCQKLPPTRKGYTFKCFVKIPLTIPRFPSPNTTFCPTSVKIQSLLCRLDRNKPPRRERWESELHAGEACF